MLFDHNHDDRTSRMETNTPFYINKLKHEYENRKERNSSYSLRAFAKALAIDAGTLTRILNGKRIPSLMLGKELISSLNLNASEAELFLNSLAKEKWNEKPLRVSQDLKNFGQPNDGEVKSLSNAYQVELDTYKILADWIHYAILELTFVNDFKSNNEWIADKTGRSVEDVEGAVERLLNLNLLSLEEGRFVKTNARITTKDKSKTTKPLKRLQKDLLGIAMRAIDEVEFDKRASVSMTMAINPKNIDKAKSAFVEFSEKMCDLLEEGEQTEIYNLIINLSPILFEDKGMKQ